MTNAQEPGPGAWNARRVLGLCGSILIWIIVAVDAWYLWPTSLGGQTSLVIVSGQSMEPTYFGGDLVIARAMEPDVGDVIVYAPEGYGGAQIVHRIIGGNGDEGWVVQGDNNSFIDPFEPTNDEVKGVVMVHYSNLGRITALVMNPILWAAVLLAALVILIWNSGDDCDDDDEELADAEDAGEESGSLLDDVREVAAAGVASMVAAGRAVASWAPRAVNPGRVRSARQATLGVMCLALIVTASTVSPASASRLDVNTPIQPAVIHGAACSTADWAATASGTASAGSYTAVALSAIPAACRGQVATVLLYNSAGALLATGTVTPTAATATVTTSSYVAANVSRVIVTVKGWVLNATWTAPVVTAPASCVAINPAGNPTGQACTVAVVQNLNSWGNSGSRIGFISYKVTTSAPSAIVTIDLSKIGFSGWNYGYVGSNSDWILRPGYSCSELPIVRLYPNPSNAGVSTNVYLWVEEQPRTSIPSPIPVTWFCPR